MAYSHRITLFIISIVIAIFSGFFFRFRLTKPTEISYSTHTNINHQMTPSSVSSAASAAVTATSRLRPVYFVSHGGPTFMYRNDDFGDSGAFDTIQSLGEHLLANPPKAVVVISAHWQEDYKPSGNGLPSVGITSTDGANSLVYDFYGFPSHMYKEQFHSNGSKALARRLAEKISTTSNGDPAFNVKLYGSRGLDHGLWVPFRVAFPNQSLQNKRNDMPFPIIQMSLPSSRGEMRSSSHSDIQHETDISYNLGNALRELRDRNGEDIAIVCSGMSVHNLRDLGSYSVPYAKEFDSSLKQAVEGSVTGRLERLTELFKSSSARKAHPTMEHIMPMAVAIGASSEFSPVEGESGEVNETDFRGKRLYTGYTRSLAWGIFEFGR